jgi:hypothetical protein
MVTNSLTLSELDMFQSIFVGFNTDFYLYFDAIVVNFLGNNMFESEIVVSNVVLPCKDTVKIVLVEPPSVVVWLSIFVLHATESPKTLPLTSTLKNTLPYGAKMVAVPANASSNAVSVITVNGRVFRVVAETALGQQFSIMMLLGSYADKALFNVPFKVSYCFPQVAVYDSPSPAVRSSWVVLLSLSFPKTAADIVEISPIIGYRWAVSTHVMVQPQNSMNGVRQGHLCCSRGGLDPTIPKQLLLWSDACPMDPFAATIESCFPVAVTTACGRCAVQGKGPHRGGAVGSGRSRCCMEPTAVRMPPSSLALCCTVCCGACSRTIFLLCVHMFSVCGVWCTVRYVLYECCAQHIKQPCTLHERHTHT